MSSVKGTARLLINSGAAKPSPAIGQALGPLGVNMMEFCKQFNTRTEPYRNDIPLPVVLTAFNDRSFNFEVRKPRTSWLIKNAAGVEKGASSPGSEIVGTLTVKHVYEIAKIKIQDEHMKNLPLKGVVKSIISSCYSMGISIVNK